MPEAQRQALARQRFARSKRHSSPIPLPDPKSDTVEVSSPCTDPPAAKPAEQIPRPVEVGHPIQVAGIPGAHGGAEDSTAHRRELETQSLGRT